jgi:hypothetical protein
MNEFVYTPTRNKTLSAAIVLTLSVVAFGPATVASEEAGSTHAESASHGGHQPQGRHELLLFLGATDDRGDWAETWGAEYGYRFMDGYYVGAFVDRAQGDIRATVVGAAFWARVVRGFMFMFGPGIEFLDEAHEEQGEHATEGGEASKRHFLARVGTGYAFHVGKYAIMPVVHADFVDGNIVWVSGVNLGLSFGGKKH